MKNTHGSKALKTHWADRGPRSPYPSGRVRQSSSVRSNFAYCVVIGPMAINRQLCTDDVVMSTIGRDGSTFLQRRHQRIPLLSIEKISVYRSRLKNKYQAIATKTHVKKESFSMGDQSLLKAESYSVGPKSKTDSKWAFKNSDATVHEYHHILTKKTTQ